MSKSLLTILLTVLAAVIFGAPAQAVLVQANGTDVFYDDFEGPASSSPPNNGAYPGDWTQTDVFQVRDQANSPGNRPPLEGLKLGYYGGGFGQGHAAATFSTPVTSGQAMHFEVALWDINPVNYGMNIAIYDSAGGLLKQFYNENGYVGAAVSADGFRTLLWVNGDWNIFEVDYVVGSTDLTVTLNGLSETKTVAAYTDIAEIRFQMAGNPGYYLIDAVPEPATMLILALGAGLSLLRRR